MLYAYGSGISVSKASAIQFLNYVNKTRNIFYISILLFPFPNNTRFFSI